MKDVIKAVFVFAAMGVILVLAGCTNWQQKYDGLNVEHQNLKGRYENCASSLENSTSELQLTKQTMEDLQRQIDEQNVSVDQATGFTGMDVAYDPGAGTITVTLPNSILFNSGKASLQKSTNAELDHVLSVIQERYRSNNIDVVGHTDSDPIKKTKKLWKDNWELSAERSLTVLRYMSSRGINPNRIRAVACGQSRPIASNASASGKARNRRVEIVVRMM